MPAPSGGGIYHPLFVLASLLFSVLGCYSGMSVVSQISASEKTPLKESLMLWLSAGAYASGFWAMYFTGNYAYEKPIPVLFNPWTILVSIVISVPAIYFLIKITFKKNTQIAPPLIQTIENALLSGVIFTVTHYVGMKSMHANAAMHLVPSSLFLTFLLASLATGLMLKIFYRSIRLNGKFCVFCRCAAAIVLGGGLCLAYYVGLNGAVFTPLEATPDFAVFSRIIPFFAVTLFGITTVLFFSLTFSISRSVFVTIALGTFCASPLILITQQAVSGLTEEIRNLEQEKFGIAYHTDVTFLLRRFLDVRDLTYAVDKGDLSLAHTLSQKLGELNVALMKVDNNDISPFENGVHSHRWSGIKANILSYLGKKDLSPADKFGESVLSVRALMDYMEDIADVTKFSADSSGGKDRLLDFAIRSTPALWESASLARATAMAMLISNSDPKAPWSESEKLALKNRLYLLDEKDLSLEKNLERIDSSNDKSLHLIDYNETVVEPAWLDFSKAIDAMLSNPEAPPPSSAEIYALATKFMDACEPFYTKPIPLFLSSLDQDRDERIMTKNVMLSSAVASFVGFVFLFFFLNRSLLRTEHAQKITLQTQKEIALRLGEKERLERQMQEYTDRLELSRFDVMAMNTKLKEEEAKIRTIMDNVLEGIIAMSEYGIIQTFNKAAETLFGYSAQEAVGETISLLVPPEQKTIPEALIRKYVETGEKGYVGIERESVGIRKDGSLFPIVVAINEVILDRTRLFIVLIRDITAQKEKEEDLRRTKEKAEAASKTKSDFLANMSHELRTPLNSILGMTHLMLGTRLSAEQQELTNTILASSTNLMEIVNDILDLSKIEAGEVKLERIGFDPRQVFHSIVRSLAHAAREKHVPLVRLYENETLPYLMGDPLRLGGILTNLLSNAIKYTEQGHIEVRAQTKKIDNTHVELRVEVTDTGIGIPVDKQQSIFDKFVQADNSTTRKYGGTGLGLAITRELVQMMDGKIGVDSQVGLGSTFWFRIPFETTEHLHEDSVVHQHPSLKGDTPPAKARLLVAEDHPMNQMLIKRLLNKFGIGTMEVVANGVDVLTGYRERGPWTAILMDCHMPEMNGYDATIAIRKMEKNTANAHIPIIAMTANAMVGDKEKCLQCGMDEYVSKPINIKELKEVLGQWIAFDPKEEEKTTGDVMTEEETPAVDLTMLRTLTGGDFEVEKELMMTFVDQSDKNIEALRETVSEEGEHKPWTEAAHMLKGGSGSIGAEELRKLCNEAQLYKGDSNGRSLLLKKIETEYARVKGHLRKEGFLS